MSASTSRTPLWLSIATRYRAHISITCSSRAKVRVGRPAGSAAAADATDECTAGAPAFMVHARAHCALLHLSARARRRAAPGSRRSALPPLPGRRHHGPGTLGPGAEEDR